MNNDSISLSRVFAWGLFSIIAFDNHLVWLLSSHSLKNSEWKRRKPVLFLWSDCWLIKRTETLWQTHSGEKKSGLTLSQKTFGPHRMSFYMQLVALYSSVHVPTLKPQRWWLHGDSGKDERGLYWVLMCCVSLIKVPPPFLRTPEMTRHVVPCKVFFSPPLGPSLTITPSHRYYM